MNDQTQELQWISAARRGDADAFESLVHLYEKRVFSLALRMCGNQEDAAEAAQEAFLAAWQALPFFRGESSFSTWLYRLTSNACVDLLRRAGVEVTIAAVGGQRTIVSSHKVAIEADALAGELDYAAFDACILPGGRPIDGR